MERLQRFLARCGVASRRHSEELIVRGRVRVNGRVVTVLGSQVDAERDVVEVDGRRVEPQARVYMVLHKPPGYLSTVRDPHGRKTVLDLVPGGLPVFPVGRLDYDATGLLLLTNDGELGYRLTHPRFGVSKTYRVLVKGKPESGDLRRVEEGVWVEGRLTAPARVRLLKEEHVGCWLEVTVREGRHHQVKLMMEAVGHPVLRLVRTRFGPLLIGSLAPGEYRMLQPSEVEALREVAGLVPRKPGRAPGDRGHAPGDRAQAPGGRAQEQERCQGCRIRRRQGRADGGRGHAGSRPDSSGHAAGFRRRGGQALLWGGGHGRGGGRRRRDKRG